MLILSNNSYFKLGLLHMIERIDPEKAKEVIFFFDDSGKLFIISKRSGSRFFSCDFLNVLTTCEYVIFEKPFSVSDFVCKFNSTLKKKVLTRSPVTAEERKIINLLLSGLSSREVAHMLNKSEKTISAQKISALTHLRIDRLSYLRSLINCWYKIQYNRKIINTRRFPINDYSVTQNQPLPSR